MVSVSKPTHVRADARFGGAGFSLLEGLIAIVILSIVALTMIPVLAAGRIQLDHADLSARAIRIAEHLIEEIVVRDYYELGSSRSDWGIGGYDAFAESPGNLTDFTGDLYVPVDQIFSRSVRVVPVAVVVADLGGVSVDGLEVTVTIAGPYEKRWELTRFVRKPYSP